MSIVISHTYLFTRLTGETKEAALVFRRRVAHLFRYFGTPSFAAKDQARSHSNDSIRAWGLQSCTFHLLDMPPLALAILLLLSLELPILGQTFDSRPLRHH